MPYLLPNSLNPMLRMAAIAGVEVVVKLHIRRGDNLNAIDGDGMTPLMLAASKNRASVCSILIEAGADPALRDSSGRDALAIAISARADRAIKVLSDPSSNLGSSAAEYPVEANDQKWTETDSLDETWVAGGLGDWEVEEEESPPEGNKSIAEAAAVVHRLISKHTPVDTAEDWSDIEVLLPESATWPQAEMDFSDGLRALLLRAVREGAVPEESVLRVCHVGGCDDEARERVVRTILTEAGVEPDERMEDSDEPLIADASEEEESAVSALLSYAKNLEPWHWDPARCYARELRTVRLLTPEEEVLLGQEMEESVSLALKAIADWQSGLDELEKAGKAVATGCVNATTFVTFLREEPAEEDGETVSNETDITYGSAVGKEFLSGIAEISRLREAGAGNVAALEVVITQLRLSPSFLIGLSTIAKSDPEAGAFKSAVERYATARETMTVCNLRMVYNVIKRYQGLGLSLEDLLQEGNIGLMRAVERYDWRRGFKFSTYATWWIRQSASRAVANTGRTIRLPAHVNSKLSVLRKAIETYETVTGKQPSDRILAESVSLPIGMVSVLRARMEEPLRIDEADADGVPFEENLSDEPESRPDAVTERVSLIEMLGRALSTLDERSVKILILRYGLDGNGSNTLEETGKHFFMTRERVRQIESKAVEKLSRLWRRKTLHDLFETINSDFKHFTNKVAKAHNSKVGPDSKSEDKGASCNANDKTESEFRREIATLQIASNTGLDDKIASVVSVFSQVKMNSLISLALENDAIVVDNRSSGGNVLIRLSVRHDTRNRKLARKLLNIGFREFPGLEFIK